MRLDDLCESFQRRGFPRTSARDHPDRALIATARGDVEQAIASDDFLLDCIALELDLMASNRPRRGLTPFFRLPDLGIRFAFGYWSPGKTAGAHEHTAWTITGVCRNALEVQTFDRDATYRTGELVTRNCFQAEMGRVGFIFEPSIHEPRNISGDWSLSMHISSPRDGEPAADGKKPPAVLRSLPKLSPVERDTPYAQVVHLRNRHRGVHQLARFIMSLQGERRGDLLERCFRLGASKTREFIAHVEPRPDRLSVSPDMFTRAHRELALSLRRQGDMIVLEAMTPNGLSHEFAIDEIASEAMAFILRADQFEIRALPGNLIDAEKQAIVAALEATGLLIRVEPDLHQHRLIGADATEEDDDA